MIPERRPATKLGESMMSGRTLSRPPMSLGAMSLRAGRGGQEGVIGYTASTTNQPSKSATIRARSGFGSGARAAILVGATIYQLSKPWTKMVGSGRKSGIKTGVSIAMEIYQP